MMTMMNRSPNQLRAAALGLSALVGLTAGAVGAVRQDDPTVQRDVLLTNAADDAHQALIDAQVAMNSSLFDQQVSFQQSVYYWADQNSLLDWLFVGDGTPASTNLFNGAWSRFTEAMLVGQAIGQVQWDHLLGVNQTLGVGGYEADIAAGLVGDLNSAGIAPGSDLATDLAALLDPATQASFDGFSAALNELQSDLYQVGFSDLLGMFSV